MTAATLTPRRAGLAVAALAAASLVLRTRALDEPLWIDEAISVGIARRPLSELPALLERDAAPPLYYALLHLWIRVAGHGEEAAHLLSLAAALAAVPLAYWAGRRIAGRPSGLAAAALAAVSPFLTLYAQEARMYALVAAASIAASAALVVLVRDGGRRAVAALAVSLGVLLYTHTWALFLLPAVLAGALAGERLRPRPGLRRDAAVAVAAAAAAFAPWAPVLLEQARHTGAPWSATPGPLALASAAWVPLGGAAALVALPAAAAGLAARIRAGDADARLAVAVLVPSAAVAVGLAWLVAQAEPNWADRYLAVVFGPLVLLAGVGIAGLGRAAPAALAAVAALAVAAGAVEPKTNVDALAAGAAPALRPGDVVVAAQPEQVPALRYYLAGGLRYESPLGRHRRPWLMDWRDALPALRAAGRGAGARRAVAALPAGARVLFVEPVPRGGSWGRAWTSAVLAAGRRWQAALAADPRLVAVRTLAPAAAETRVAVRGTIYVVRPRQVALTADVR